MYVCLKKGPNGSPTYDKAGFRLDYHKVEKTMRPRAYNKKAIVDGMQRTLDREEKEAEKMSAIFFKGGKAPKGSEGKYAIELLKDKVSKDLGIAWHKVTSAKVEQWSKQGYPKENPRDYIRSTVTEEEKKRFSSLETCSKFRM